MEQLHVHRAVIQANTESFINKGSYFHCHNCVPQKISSVCNKCNQKIATLYVYESNGNYNTVTVPCACSIQK